jgi:pyrroloquinoline quinone biosynthesis protein E
LWVPPQAGILAVVERPKRYALAVELTSHCNQKCSYCYNAWREDNGRGVGALPSDDLVELLDRALTEVEFDHVTLTGGEPFTRPDLVRVLEVCKRHGVGIQMISNGGVVDARMAGKLVGFPIRCVQVTLDGPTAELHDEHVGGDHFHATLAGIAALQAVGVLVVGCIVVTRKNAALVGEILDVFRGLGVTTIALSRFSPAGYAARNVAELLPSRSDIVTALSQGQARAEAHGMDLQVTMPVPPCVVETSDYPAIRFGACPIGTEMQEFALGPRGELRSCTLHTDVIGDAKTTSFAELVAAPAVVRYRDTTPEFCAPCPHRDACLGGCGAAAASVLGDARGLDPFVAQHVDDAFAARLRSERAFEKRVHLPVSS